MKTKILKHGLYHLFSTLPLLSLLGGCVANSPQKEITEPIPEWFMNTPNDTGNFYFGVGEGRSKDVAKNVALNDIASRISVTVKSTLSSEINQKIAKGKELITRNSQQKLLAQVKAIEFSNYNIDKMIVQNNRNYVLVKVNRIALYKKRLKKLNVKMNAINAQWARYNSLPAFNRLNEVKLITAAVDEVKVMLPVISAIYTSFNDADYRGVLNQYINEMLYLKDSIVALFDRGNPPEIESVIKKHLSQQGIKILSSTANLSKKKRENLIVIKVTSKAVPKQIRSTNRQLKNARFAKLTITLTTSNLKKNVLAKNIVSVTNISQISYADAVSQTKKFDGLIKKKGIIAVLSGVMSACTQHHDCKF